MANHRQVVRDEQIAQPEARAQGFEQVDDLRLDRYVERGHGFVANQQFRARRQRPRDAHPLALAAAEFVRIAVQGIGTQAHQFEQLGHLPAEFVFARKAVDNDRFGDCLTHREPRIQRAERILEHHLDAPPIGPQCFVAQGAQVDPVEDHLALLRAHQLHDGAAQRGLAAAALTDQTERFALGDGEAHAVDRHQRRGRPLKQRAGLAPEAHPQVDRLDHAGLRGTSPASQQTTR